MIIAIYRVNDKIYKTTNLKKSIKKKNINEILYQLDYSGNIQSAEDILDRWIKVNLKDYDKDLKYYYFKNKKTGNIIRSIYDNLDNLKKIIKVHEYARIS